MSNPVELGDVFTTVTTVPPAVLSLCLVYLIRSVYKLDKVVYQLSVDINRLAERINQYERRDISNERYGSANRIGQQHHRIPRYDHPGSHQPD